MDKLDSYKSKAPAIIGSTTINHEARIRLGLNCSEYCLLDHLTRQEDKGQHADMLTIYINTGFTMAEVEKLFGTLVLKGFARVDNGKYILTKKWEEGFADIENEFDNMFWKIDNKVVWTGTRKKALEYYVKLRKRYSSEFLMTQRNNYFNFLLLQKQLTRFDQQKMMCQVFLNPMTERFNEDYAEYIVQLKNKYGVTDKPKPEPLTREAVNAAYGKNNNK
jgi:hypothetical protein